MSDFIIGAGLGCYAIIIFTVCLLAGESIARGGADDRYTLHRGR